MPILIRKENISSPSFFIDSFSFFWLRRRSPICHKFQTRCRVLVILISLLICIPHSLKAIFSAVRPPYLKWIAASRRGWHCRPRRPRPSAPCANKTSATRPLHEKLQSFTKSLAPGCENGARIFREHPRDTYWPHYAGKF